MVDPKFYLVNSNESHNFFVAVNVTAPNTAKSKPLIETEKILGVLEFPNGTRLVIHSAELNYVMQYWSNNYFYRCDEICRVFSIKYSFL